jgi:hypothetical protein
MSELHIRRLWAHLDLGLQIQRIHLHLSDCRHIANSGEALPDLLDIKFPRALAARPRKHLSAFSTLWRNSKMTSWIDPPITYGITHGPANGLFLVAGGVAEKLYMWPPCQELRPLSLAALHQATAVVTTGMLIRFLEDHLRHNGVRDSALRAAYSSALDSSVTLEKGMPTLIDELQEPRLVDLVTTSIPWRGQFTKYSGGAGAGQVQ